MSMSIWDFIHTNSNHAGLERLYANYQLPFLIEIRDQLKFWIEENFINSNAYLDADNPDHYPTIYTLLHAFIIKIGDEVLRLRREDPQARVLINKLDQAANLMKNELAFRERVQILYKRIRHILNLENGFVILLQQQTKRGSDARRVSADQNSGPQQNIRIQNQVNPGFAQIGAACLELKMEADNSTKILRCIHQKQTEVAESYCLQKTLEEISRRPVENGETKAEDARKQLEDLKSAWNKMCEELNYFVRDFKEKNRRIFIRSSALLNDVIQKELGSRRYETATWTTNSIDILQGYCSDFAEVLLRCRLQLLELQGLYPNMNELSNLQAEFSELSRKLERLALIIETQPCQVIKKGTKFTAKVRYLAGSRSPNMSAHVSYGNVTASFLTKAEVRKLVRFDTESKTMECKPSNGTVAGPSKPVRGTKTTSVAVRARAVKTPANETLQLKNEIDQKIAIEIGGEIVNNVEPLQTDDASFSATFQTSKIENIFKRDREPGKSVLDLEYWILFHMTITETVNGFSNERWVCVVSNPIKVHTHADQRHHAFETIIWLNAMDPEMLFSDSPRPKTLPWPNVARALNSKCLEMTGFPLSTEQLEVLKEKAFSVPGKNGYVSNDHLTFNQFCKTEFSSELKFTFWRWFYEIMKLTAKHMCGSEGKSGPFQNGHIAGFISRSEAERRLMLDGTVGSFILRYSDSTLGGISIVGLQHNGVCCSTFAVAPFSNEDLCKRPLAERILDLPVLTHLYPNKPKADIFSPYQQKKDVTVQSTLLHRQYVKTFLQTVVNLPVEPKRETFATPSPRSSIVSSLAQPTPPATPSYPYLMSNDSPTASYSAGYSPSSSNGFGGYREDESSDPEEVMNQLKMIYPIDSSPVDDFYKDLETFLSQCNIDHMDQMDTSYDSQDKVNSDDDQMPSSTMSEDFESDYL